MKAFIIIIACLVVALCLKVVDLLTSGKIKSVGAKSNNNSRNIPTIDITDPESIKAGLEHYKGLAD